MEAQLTGNLQMMERSQVPLYRILCLSSVGAIELATGAEEETRGLVFPQTPGDIELEKVNETVEG